MPRAHLVVTATYRLPSVFLTVTASPENGVTFAREKARSRQWASASSSPPWSRPAIRASRRHPAGPKVRTTLAARSPQPQLS